MEEADLLTIQLSKKQVEALLGALYFAVSEGEFEGTDEDYALLLRSFGDDYWVELHEKRYLTWGQRDR